MTKEKYSYGYARELYKPIKLKEDVFNNVLEDNEYFIVRFDGKDMTKSFKLKRQAINEMFFNAMHDTFYEFCNSTDKIQFAYSFSDEISILIMGSGKSMMNIIGCKKYYHLCLVSLP